jgi:endo-beta-N-acetylglucosaminidase D
MRFLLLLTLLFSLGTNAAQLLSNQPPFALTLEQVARWAPDSELASSENVSRQPLVRRIPAPLGEQQPGPARVLYAPDGMNNFANYLDTQPVFNLYNFSHWSQIHVLNWFAGTAEHTVQIPARPWVDTAHRNGVKVIGSVFLAVAQWGGSADTAERLLAQDDKGRFIFADKLIEIADFYGFDGWLINQETDLTAVKDGNNELLKDQRDPERGKALAGRMLSFMQYLTARAPENMEIHWYDAMVPSGEVRWQNELNQHNSRYLQSNVRSSDAIFLNYWWDEQKVLNSRQQALDLGRSPYEVFFGVDLWPSRNAQRAFSRTAWLDWLFDDGQPLTSVALFAPNFNYNFDGEPHTPAFSQFEQDGSEVEAFYRAERRLFAGDNLNPAIPDQQGWKGLGAYFPASSTVTSLPFTTHFNTGQGKVLVDKGKQVGGPWTQMERQDILPTWQFAVSGNQAVSLKYDFDKVFDGGSSLAIGAERNAELAIIPLYQTSVIAGESGQLRVVFQGHKGLSVYLQTADGQQFDFALPASTDWQLSEFSLSALAGQKVQRIGLKVQSGKGQLDANLGMLEMMP